MNLARGIEKRLENLVDGVSASVFRGRMHPVTMASKLIRQLDFLATDTDGTITIPNDLTIVVHPSDLDPELDVADLEEELAVVVEDAAKQSGWKLVGPVEIHLATSSEVPRGILQVAGDRLRGPLPPWGQLIADDGSAVIPLTMNSQVVGRALDCDIRLSNSEVSRHHAVIARSSDGVSVRDLRSSNGTKVNGDLISVDPASILPGSNISFGELLFTYRPVS
ncbi:MAG: FhaA domain-containing protein [Acidimicrobiia bacterium]